MRETGEEPFDVGGYLLPPRSSVFVGTYVMQRDPELWPKADAFVPERFLPVS
jgi:cytochrome P450